MSEIESWARVERQFLKEEIDSFKAGAKLMSPSGDDISVKKMDQLKSRLEHVQKLLTADPMADIMREMGKTPQERSS